MYTTRLHSPLGTMMLASNGAAVTGLWLEGQTYYASTLDGSEREDGSLPVFHQAAAWLEAYFSGTPPPSPAAAGSRGHPLPAGGVGTAAGNSPWAGDHLRGAGAVPAGTGDFRIPTGGGRRCGAQSHLHPHPLPPGGGQRRQPDRLRRRFGSQDATAAAGRCPIKKHKGEKS